MQEQPIAAASLSSKEIQTKKVCACAVNLGVNILEHMIGDTISKSSLVDNCGELIATAILGELKL